MNCWNVKYLIKHRLYWWLLARRVPSVFQTSMAKLSAFLLPFWFDLGLPAASDRSLPTSSRSFAWRKPSHSSQLCQAAWILRRESSSWTECLLTTRAALQASSWLWTYSSCGCQRACTSSRPCPAVQIRPYTFAWWKRFLRGSGLARLKLV